LTEVRKSDHSVGKKLGGGKNGNSKTLDYPRFLIFEKILSFKDRTDGFTSDPKQLIIPKAKDLDFQFNKKLEEKVFKIFKAKISV